MRDWLRMGLLCAVLCTGSTAALAAGTDDIDTPQSSSSSSSSGSTRSIIKYTGHQERPQMLSFFLNVPWWYGIGIGVGGRYAISVAPDGFLNKVNDSFELEFGLDYVFRSWWYVNYHSIIIPFEVRWTFYFLPRLAAYIKAGLGVEVGFGGNYYGGFPGPGPGPWPYGSVGTGVFLHHNLFAPGILFKLTDGMWLRGELGYWGLKAGLGFTF